MKRLLSQVHAGAKRAKKRKVCCPSCLHPGIKLDRKTADKRLRFVCEKCSNWWTEGRQ